MSLLLLMWIILNFKVDCNVRLHLTVAQSRIYGEYPGLSLRPNARTG
ncbi:MAG: hypothetical protein OEZ36_04895 [Spirochaetota bacterium]|nr:hypothetical protein [Spirochaetota bacterium]